MLLALCAGALASCGGMSGGGSGDLKSQNDSLKQVLQLRDAELDEMLATFNDISDGFREINEAENRVNLQRNAVGEGSVSAREQMASDIEFIRKQMQENKEQIAKLQGMLQSSKANSAQLKRAVESLTRELADKTRRIEELQAELAARNVRIQELDETVSGLTAQNQNLEAENAAKAETVSQQD